ncbi:MAG: ribonuclease H-like domain-containing protein [Candidatus Altimarinota bacterium]
MKQNKPRILFYDIETSLQPVLVFQLANNDWISPESILSERHLVSVCWKWEGENKVHSVSLIDDLKRFKKDPHDDKFVVQEFYKVLMEADVLVAHNGDKFDLPYIKTRMLFHGLPPLPPISTIDTYKIAKSQFMLNSNKLNYLGHLLKVGKKIETSQGLWMRVFQGDPKAVKEMVEYNKGDVELLERVFLKLRPYCANHINRELFGGIGCPRCGSSDIQSRGTHKAITKTYQRFQCQSCFGWFKLLRAEKEPSTKYKVL